jgi:signal transduction histidine kinase
VILASSLNKKRARITGCQNRFKNVKRVPMRSEPIAVQIDDQRGSPVKSLDISSPDSPATAALPSSERTSLELWPLDVGNRIERAKQEWEVTADSLPQLICVIDERGRILRANRTAERWRLAAVTEIRGMSLDDLLHGRCDDPACYLKTFMLPRGRRVRCQAEDPVLDRPLELVAMPTLVSREEVEARSLGSFAVVVVEDVTGIKRTEAALRQSESELRLLSAQLLTSQEMERKRIASELHDSVGASLAAIKLTLEQAIQSLPSSGADAGRGALEALVQRMRETVGEVRRIAMDLRPATLDDLGLVATLSWFFRDFASIHPGIRLVKDIDIAERDIPAALRTTIFRIVQEGVSNVVKHARTDALDFRFKRLPCEIEVVIEDRGCGFDLAEVTKSGDGVRGLGLASMRDRAELSGGLFEIRSMPGQGTRLRAAWPIARTA